MIKRHFPLVGPLVYDVKIMIHVIGGYYRIIYYRKSIASSAKNLIVDLIFLSRSLI